MEQSFEGKNVLFISPRFFNYEFEIQKELERKGASVYFIDDRIKDSILIKILFRLKLGEKIARNKVTQYFTGHLEKIKGRKIDYVLAITPEGFSKRIAEQYKQELNSAFFVLYMWDSIRNRPYLTETMSLYDKVFTFDRNDAREHGFTLRPLFYTDDYQKISKLQENIKPEFDLCFIGTAHSDRYMVVKRLINSSARRLKCYLFFYLQHPVMIIWHRLVDPGFKQVKVKDLSFNSLTKHQIVDVVGKSACIIDIHHPRQIGLTMRTIEVLGAQKKLITTNADVLNYDFYNPANIAVIDRSSPVLDDTFLSIPYQQPQVGIYNKYSISYWVDEVFNKTALGDR